MEFRLGTISKNGREFSFGEILSYSEYSNLMNMVNEISLFNQNKRLFLIVSQNIEDLIAFINETINLIKNKLNISWNAIGGPEHEELNLKANRLFLNYLSSIRTFLDHSETFLKRVLGNDSAESKEFENSKATIYDESFAYKFFYKLRNYSQHVGLPLEGFSYSSNLETFSGTRDTVVKVVFNKEILLKEFDWKLIKNELSVQPDKFELLPLLKEVDDYINSLSKVLRRIISKKVMSSAIYLNEKTLHLKNTQTYVCIFSHVKQLPKKAVQFNAQHIPFDLIDEIINGK